MFHVASRTYIGEEKEEERVASVHSRVYIHTHTYSRNDDHSSRTQAFYVRVIKHFACEGIIVGVGPVRAVYTVLVRRGTARDSEGCVVSRFRGPGRVPRPLFHPVVIYRPVCCSLSLFFSLTRSLAAPYTLGSTDGEGGIALRYHR